MNWHFFGGYGWGGHGTDPGEGGFVANLKRQVPEIHIHDSPYLYWQFAALGPTLDALPEEDGVIIEGTSLSSNDVPYLALTTKRVIDGAFGFQASIYGYHGALPRNILFAHLIYSYNPIPLPGLGGYRWDVGAMNPASYHQTKHDIPHPGDYDLHDQNMFIQEIQRIIANTRR